MIHKLGLAVICLAAVFVMPVNVLAQEAEVGVESAERTLDADQAPQNPLTLDPVVVTAGRTPESMKRVTAAMTVIPPEELEKAQYSNLSDILQNYGIQINSYPPGSSMAQISIRGVRSSAVGSDLQGSVLLLLDGHRVGTDNVGMIPLINIERIEIIRGPASVQYGTAAIGGVVNVITKRGQEPLSAFAETGVGSWDGYTLQGGLSGVASLLDFSGAISYSSQNDYSTGRHQTYDNTGYNFNTNYSMNLGFNFLPEHRLGLILSGTKRDDMGSPGYINAVQKHDYTNRSNYSYDVGYEGGVKEYGFSWMARYYHGNNFYYFDNHETPRANFYQTRTQYQGTQLQASYELGPLSLTGGWDWLKYDTSNGSPTSNSEKSDYKNMAGFLLAKMGFFDDILVLNAGMRYDDYKLALDGNDKHLHRTTPSVGLAVHATDWLSLRANYGESYRIPDANALLGFDAGFYKYIGNPDLKPEKGRSWDVGFMVDYSPFNAGLTYFETYYRDKIVATYTPTYDTQYYNIDDKVTYRGFEAQASYDLGQQFNWPFMLRPYVNLTWMLYYKADDGTRAPNVSNLDLAYGLNFDYPGIGLNADLRFNYLGKQYVEDFNYASSTYGQTVRTGGDTTVDFFISKTIYSWENAGKVSIKAEVRNIFDQYYATIKDYPMPGRSFYIGLRYDY